MKYYARIGRRFVQVKSAKGMFYNNDGTFTEKRTDKSIGICVHDDFDETIIASLNECENAVTYGEAESICKAAFPLGEGHIPTSNELFMLKSMDNIKPKDFVSLWVSDKFNDAYRAHFLYFEPSGVCMSYCGISYREHKVIPFLTIKDRI